MTPFTHVAALLTATLFLAGAARAQSFDLLRDIYPGFSDDLSSKPSDYAQLGSLALFSAENPLTGREAWVTDGTPSGTRLLKDCWPGSSPGFVTGFAVSNQHAWFFAEDGVHGRELWITDGTPLGTSLYEDLLPGPGSYEIDWLRAGAGKLFFSGRRAPASTWELFVFDPVSRTVTQLSNVAGTSLLATRSVSIGTSAGLWFFGSSAPGRFAPWLSDGTTSGTRGLPGNWTVPYAESIPRLLDLGSHVAMLAVAGTSTNQQLVLFDASGTQQVVLDGTKPEDDPRTIKELHFDGRRLWVSGDSDQLLPEQVWVAPLQQNGMYRLVDQTNSPVRGRGFFDAPGEVWFAGHTKTHGADFIRSDGTPQGTRPSALGTKGLTPLEGLALGKRILLIHRGVGQPELRVTDGTAQGTELLLDSIDFAPLGDSTSGESLLIAPVGQRALFFVDDRIHRLEPWSSDGTRTETRLLANIALGTFANGSWPLGRWGEYGGHAFFAADAPISGNELWKSDGTKEGTVQVWGSAGSFPRPGMGCGGRFWFTATEPVHGPQLFSTDGSSAGTRRETTLFSTTPSYPPEIVARLGQKLVIRAETDATGMEFFVHDTASRQTSLLLELRPGAAGVADAPVCQAGERLFVYDAQHAPSAAALWVSDGTPKGTSAIRIPVLPALPSPEPVCFAFGPRVFFNVGATSGTPEPSLWVSDGTPGGTGRFGPAALDVVVAEGRIYWTQKDVAGRSLWTSQGDPQSVRQLGVFATDIRLQGTLRESLLFVVGILDQCELWVTDGTTQGTARIRDRLAGGRWRGLALGARRFLLFMLYDQNDRRPFLVTDGTAQGTQRLTSPNPPPAVAAQTAFPGRTVSGVCCFALDGPSGNEPYRFTYGAGQNDTGLSCGASGARLSMDDPVLGSAARLRGHFAPAGHVGVWFLGAIDAAPNFALGSHCELYVDPARIWLLDAFAVPGPSWQRTLPIPSDIALTDLVFATQVFYVDPVQFALQSTQGIQARIGR